MKTIMFILFILTGIFLAVLGLIMARWFLNFTVIPGFLEVTFPGNVIIFSLICVLGGGLSVFGIVKLSRKNRLSV